MEELIRVRMAAEALEEWAACEGPCLNDMMTLGDPNWYRDENGIPRRGDPPKPRQAEAAAAAAPAPAAPAAPADHSSDDSDSECENGFDSNKTIDLEDLDTSCSEREVRNDTILYKSIIKAST